MPKFQYQRKQKMDPLPGKKYYTTDYQMTHAQKQQLREHVHAVRDQ